MPNYNPSTRNRIADIKVGIRVDRPAATHAAATTPYFHVVGGHVLLTGLVGEITVESGANACSWLTTPDIGATDSICADLDINPALVGDALTIPGPSASAMTYTGSAAGLPMLEHPILIPEGTLDFIAAAADGATKWSMFYVPLESGAYVEIV